MSAIKIEQYCAPIHVSRSKEASVQNTSASRTRTELEAAVPQILQIIGQSYAPLFRNTDIFHGSQSASANATWMDDNAALEGIILSLRRLNRFFEIESKGDQLTEELRACDFLGFKSPGRFLPPEVRDEIDVLLVHMSGQSAKVPQPPWILEQVEAALQQSFPFVKYLITDFFGNDLQSAEFAIATWNTIPLAFNHVRELRRTQLGLKWLHRSP